MPATVLWTSTEVKSLYIRELGNVTSGPIANVKSCDALDVENYDNSNYRDDFFNTKSGENNVLIEVGGSASATDYVTKATEAGVFTDGSVGGAGNRVNSAIDAVAHIPPRNEAKMRTMIRLWSDSSGTGNVLYSGWADEIVSFSLAPYTFI